MRLVAIALFFALLSLAPLSAQPRAMAEPARSSAGTVSIRVEKLYYDVDGETPTALAAQLGEHGPEVSGEQYFGMTEWEVHAEYRWAKRPSGCRLAGLVVRASVQTHLPRWNRGDTAPASLSGAWGRFVHALEWHEDGHRALAEDAAEAIRGELVALRSPSCARLEAEAHRTVIAVLNEYERYNVEYDAATDHGRTQGAIWPPQP